MQGMTLRGSDEENYIDRFESLTAGDGGTSRGFAPIHHARLEFFTL
jgi:hypothetical protein